MTSPMTSLQALNAWNAALVEHQSHRSSRPAGGVLPQRDVLGWRRGRSNIATSPSCGLSLTPVTWRPPASWTAMGWRSCAGGCSWRSSCHCCRTHCWGRTPAAAGWVTHCKDNTCSTMCGHQGSEAVCIYNKTDINNLYQQLTMSTPIESHISTKLQTVNNTQTDITMGLIFPTECRTKMKG